MVGLSTESTNVRIIVGAFVCLTASSAAAQRPFDEAAFVPAVMSHTALRDGYRHAAAGRWIEARRAFEAAIRAEPCSAVAHLNLGAALVALDLREAAMAAYRAALRCEPRLLEARINLGVELSRAGRHREAVDELARAARQAPADHTVQHNLGVVLATLERHDEAIPALEAAARRVPRDAVVRRALAATYYNRGLAWAKRGGWNRAIDDYRRALNLNADLVEGHYALALALMALGRGDEALAACRKALLNRPDFPQARQLQRALEQRADAAPADVVLADSRACRSTGVTNATRRP